MGSCISRPQTTEAIVIDMPKKKPTNEDKPKRVAAVPDDQEHDASPPNHHADPVLEQDEEAQADQEGKEAETKNPDAQEEDNQAGEDGEAENGTNINDIEFTVANYPGEDDVEYYTMAPDDETYVITAIHLHNFYDDEQDVDYFNGIKIEWTHPETREVTTSWVFGSETANKTSTYEVSNLDYIKEVVWSQSGTADSFMTHFGFKPKMGELQEVGSKGEETKVIQPDNSEGPCLLFGMEVGRSKVDLGMIVWVKPIWKPLPESKVLNLKSSNRSFLNDPQTLNTELLDRQTAYLYKKSSEVFSEFEAVIDSKNRAEEYLGALPTRFLSPQDQQRLDKMLKDIKATHVIKQLKEKSKFHQQTLSADLKKDIANVCIALITKELRAGKGLDSVSENIRFLNKIFAALYNDDHGIWDEVKKNVGTSCTEFNTIIFKEAIDQMLADAEMANIQAEPDYQDPDFKGVNQKGCPQKVDEAGKTEVGDIINQYIHEAKDIIMEYHGTMRKLFGSHYIGAPVKGFNRIKAKVEEYMEEDKLSPSDAVAKVMDFVRGTVVSYTGQELKDSLAKLRSHQSFKIVRIKNGFKDLKKEAFKSILINIMAFNCMICEIQLTLKPMKTFNEISHFIYEIQREESLYNMVANHLNINQQFKSWLEPFIPSERKQPLPERELRWKGFVEGGPLAPGGFMGGGTDVLGFFNQSGTDAYLDMKLTFTKDGTITGTHEDLRKLGKIEGTHQNYKTVEFTLDGMVINHFKGKFIDSGIIEGTIATGRMFRFYVGDINYPSISAISVDADFSKTRKIDVPDEGINWAGYSYDIKCPKTKQPLKFMMRFNDGNGIGFGTMGEEMINIVGIHENFRTFSFKAEYIGHQRFFDGVFVNNYTVKGKYNEKGEMGNFEINITDPSILAILDPHNTRNA